MCHRKKFHLYNFEVLTVKSTGTWKGCEIWYHLLLISDNLAALFQLRVTYLQTYKSLWLILLMAELTYHMSACCQKCVIHRAILQFLLLNIENCPMTIICESQFMYLETF